MEVLLLGCGIIYLCLANMLISTSMKQLFSFLLCLLVSTATALGQGKSLSGVVTDAKSQEPIYGAAVVIKGVSGSGAMTDAQGKFTLSQGGCSDDCP